ncbi:MAG: Ldh family oxidoreductase [Rubrobacteraceae bacterium]
MRVDKDRLTDLVRDIFDSLDVPPRDAGEIADHLVKANLRGVETHGVSRVGVYVERLESGLVEKETHVQLVHQTPVSALLDGGNGSGIVIANHAAALAVEKAEHSGVGIVCVRRSNHCGMLAYYTQHIVDQGFIALATTNAPANMAPWGAADRFFGANPISYGIPTGKEIDIVFDMSTSNVARGKIILAAGSNQKIPLGWAIGPDGEETTEPGEALKGLLLPLGGAKGSGIAFLVEVLSSVLSGASVGPHVAPLYGATGDKQDVGHFFMAFRPDLFMTPEDFRGRMDRMVGEIRSLPVAGGHERIYLPGEIELERERERGMEGIPLTRELAEELERLAVDCDVLTNLRQPGE